MGKNGRADDRGVVVVVPLEEKSARRRLHRCEIGGNGRRWTKGTLWRIGAIALRNTGSRVSRRAREERIGLEVAVYIQVNFWEVAP